MKSSCMHLVVLGALALGITGNSALAAQKSSDKPVETKAAGQKTVATKPAPYTGPVELNSATKAQLMSIPEITEEYADKIIEERPYREKISLRRQKVLPADVFYAVIDKVKIDPDKWKKLYDQKAREAAGKKK
jgi:DNA uptake protein ComE-like DNA-binding protein